LLSNSDDSEMEGLEEEDFGDRDRDLVVALMADNERIPTPTLETVKAATLCRLG